jgi:hypothetical protein
MDWSPALFTLSLFAISRGEFFEIYAIAKERYRVETVRSAKKNCKGFPCDLRFEKFSGGRFRSLKTTNRDGATSDDRRLGRRRVVVGLTLRETTAVKSMRRRANAA